MKNGLRRAICPLHHGDVFYLKGPSWRVKNRTPEGGPTEEGAAEQARELVAMLRRHAQAVLGAMRDQVARNADDLIRPDRLPATCLVRLVPMGASPPKQVAMTRPRFDL